MKIYPKTKMIKTYTPILRFKEFTDEWQEKKLGDLCDKPKYGLNASAIKYDGINKYLRITDIYEHNHKFSVENLTSPSNFSEEFLLSYGDLLFTRTGASTGKTYLYDKSDGKLYFAGFLIKFKVINAIPYFVYSQTLRYNYSKWSRVMSARSGQPGINAEEYSGYKFFCPSIPEQQKIADFLGAVDEKIEKLEEKNKAFEKCKKGIMQAIFSQKIRFKKPDGSNYPDWEEKKLGEICRIVKGQQINGSDLVKSGMYKMLNGGISASGYTSDWNVEANTITISEGGNSCGHVNFISERFWSGGHCYSIQGLDPGIVNKFLFQILKYNQKLIMRLRVGSGLPNIQKNDLNKLLLNIPTKPEQEKIAEFLTALDNKINLINNQLEQVKLFKKSLLQRMFV